MMKKIVSMAMAAVMAVTLMVAAPAEVKAEGLTTPVSYTNDSVLTDPEVPAVSIKIPPSITFTEDSREITANVYLESSDESYDVEKYTKTATVTVASNNGYELKTQGVSAGLPYTLTYGGNVMGSMDEENNEINSVGVLGGAVMNEEGTAVETAAVTLISGKAVLPDSSVATQQGVYTDTLVYTIQLESASSAEGGN